MARRPGTSCACVAGADLPEEEEQLAHGRDPGACGWSETAAVANDTFAVLRAPPCGRLPWRF